jgi:aconitate hydratase
MALFDSKSTLKLNNGEKYVIYRIKSLDENKIADTTRIPFSIRILIENLLRKEDLSESGTVTIQHINKIAGWKPDPESNQEVPYYPSRVIMQDFTGIPAIVDLASMRDIARKYDIPPQDINPVIPVDLVIDHSVQIDFAGSEDALQKNIELDYSRNKERYSLFKWAQNAFKNFRVFPPGVGIIHQINLEYISQVVAVEESGNERIAYPDTLIGTDSHTTMINGLGILGWGVGGIEAEAVMLGQPVYIKIPEVIGVKLIGEIPDSATATDIILAITEKLRKENVVEKFVEFFGPGVRNLHIPDRATISNMAPEYGATVGFFPIDEEVLDYLRDTNRENLLELVEKYSKEQGLFCYGNEEIKYSRTVVIDLSRVKRSLAGPSKPQQRLDAKDIKDAFSEVLKQTLNRSERKTRAISYRGEQIHLSDGSVMIAAIASCTNTSNPHALIGAGLLAKKAVQMGLFVKSHVKTSFTPGSLAVDGYLKDAKLYEYLSKLGFNIVAHGCASCIGNSGPLDKILEQTIIDSELICVSVLSGNRNFEARIHPHLKANYLTSPGLVIAYALAGTINIDLEREPLGHDSNNRAVYLKDIWPSKEEISKFTKAFVRSEVFKNRYANVLKGDKNWEELSVPEGLFYEWDTDSSYIKQVPFFDGFKLKVKPSADIVKARCLLSLGNTVTTDHISPAAGITEEYPAGQYLLEHKINPENFNSYGARRGNHQVMLRGTFANLRIKNQLISPREGGFSVFLPTNSVDYVYPIAQKYREKHTPLIVFAGSEYGTGSARDWAAKGTCLLGIKVVIAQSFERIHRSNLVGMGVLPLQFEQNCSLSGYGLSGREEFSIEGINNLTPRKRLKVTSRDEFNNQKVFFVKTRLDTKVELQYYLNNGILPLVLRKIIG